MTQNPTGSRPSRTTATAATIWLSLGGVSLIAALASYLHALAVVQAADGQTLVAWFIPALADLAIFASSANILDASRRGFGVPKLSALSVAVSVLVTLGANVAAGDPHAVPSWLVNVWPPVAFILALESLLGYVRRGRGGTAPAAVPATSSQPEPPEPPTKEEALALLLATDSRRKLAAALGVPRSRVDAWAARVAEPAGEEPVEVSLNGADPHD